MHSRTDNKKSPSNSPAQSTEKKSSECATQLINPVDVKKTAEIARGTFATIYKGTWQQKTVAVKRITSGLEFVDNEINIMTILTSLDAPNCVKLHGYFYVNCTYSLIMEYMPNGSLAKLVDRKKLPHAWRFCVDAMRNISSAVVFMHQHNIVHRDIKPENIIFDENMQAKLCDFGLSKFIDAHVQFAGTMEYLAPEIRYQPYTFKADVFSLSVSLWEAVADCRPYINIPEGEIYKNVSDGYREPIPDECPQRLAHLISWGWAQSPQKRPTAQQFLAELNKKDILK